MSFRKALIATGLLVATTAQAQPAAGPFGPAIRRLPYQIQLLCEPYISKRQSAEDLTPMVQRFGYSDQEPEKTEIGLISTSFSGPAGNLTLSEFPDGRRTCSIIRAIANIDRLQADFADWASHVAVDGPFVLKKGGTGRVTTDWVGATWRIYIEPSDTIVMFEASMK